MPSSTGSSHVGEIRKRPGTQPAFRSQLGGGTLKPFWIPLDGALAAPPSRSRPLRRGLRRALCTQSLD